MESILRKKDDTCVGVTAQNATAICPVERLLHSITKKQSDDMVEQQKVLRNEKQI
jgi:hypothetical protein